MLKITKKLIARHEGQDTEILSLILKPVCLNNQVKSTEAALHNVTTHTENAVERREIALELSQP
jgi:hypothetical protein